MILSEKSQNDIVLTFEQLIGAIPMQMDIVLYGLGSIAEMLAWCLKKNERAVKMYIVTDTNSSTPQEIDSVPVCSLEQAEWNIQKTAFIIASKRRISQIDIMDRLLQKKAANIFLINDSLDNSIRENYLSGLLMEHQKEYSILPNCECEPNHYTIVYGEMMEFHWRIHKENSLPLKNLFALQKKDLLDLFNMQYGSYTPLSMVSINESAYQEYEYIYAAKSHMDKIISTKTEYKIIKYVQAGAAYTQQHICTLSDNIGDNISIKNKNYSECTVLYWIWKHITNVEYIGFCHYRRIFDLPFDNLACLRETGIDIILTTPTICDCTIKNYFVRRYISKNDWEYMMEGIRHFSEEYYQTAIAYEKSYFFSPCNMLIMKRTILNKYCTFAFGIAEYIEKQYQKIALRRQDRYMGYIFENMLAIFVMHHKDKYSVAYTDIKYLK